MTLTANDDLPSDRDPTRSSPALRNRLSIDQLATGVVNGDMALLAQAITLVESSRPDHQELAAELLSQIAPHTGGAIRLAISGMPGVGKSTLIERLGMDRVAAGQRLAVLAVDPSSTLTGGSILGDKTRMPRLASSADAYIRPSPSGGTLGGVARKTHEALLLCEAARFDLVIVETVGVGQSEATVADLTDVFLLLTLPGAGDELQAIKRGVLERVDVLAVNKADGQQRMAAEVAASQYRAAFHSQNRAPDRDAPEVITCSARDGTGVTELWQAVAARHARLRETGRLTTLRQAQSARRIWTLVDDELAAAVRNDPRVQSLCADFEKQVEAGRLTTFAAARAIVKAFRDAPC